MGKKRAKKVSSGVRKVQAAKGINRERRSPVSINVAGEEEIRQAANRRWPTKEQEALYFELNTDKKNRNNRPANRIKPPAFGFALLESVKPAVLKRMLLCASLKYKRVRRYPGWILQRTYNLKGRPIDFS